MDVINCFPGYEYVVDEYGKPHNMYRGEDVGFGGYVYSEPGMYGRTVVYDVQSMHPHSIVAMNVFGDYTPRYKAILDGRIALKHKDINKAKEILGTLSPAAEEYLNDDSMAKPLANALKLMLNMAYGYTSGSFDNPMRDKRNVNNIVALRGALFMVTLRDEIQKRGYKVISIKTDSIKVVEPSKEIEKFIFDFGNRYGYDFEIENIFSKICLVNDSTFIALCADDDPDTDMRGKWLAKAMQFQVPYVFKTLFSHEKIEFDDLCETKSVTRGDLYLDMNEGLPDVSKLEDEQEKLLRDYANLKVRKGYHSLYEMENQIKVLEDDIRDGHKLVFVGRVGRFCPINPGSGGGILYRVQDGKKYAATGTTGYRWLEAEHVQKYGLQDRIDMSYFNKLVDDAADAICKFGDLEWFLSGEVGAPLPDFLNVPIGTDEEVPFDKSVIVGKEK